MACVCLASCRPVRKDGAGLEVAAAWSLDVATHFIRKVSYKGSRHHVSKDRIRVSYDGLTIPAVIFTASKHVMKRLLYMSASSNYFCGHESEVAHVLQTQGCKPTMQQSCLHALRVLLLSSAPPDMDLPLLNDVPDSASAEGNERQVANKNPTEHRSHSHSETSCEAVQLDGVLAELQSHEEALGSTQHALSRCGLARQRWQLCKILTPMEQQHDAGSCFNNACKAPFQTQQYLRH